MTQKVPITVAYGDGIGPEIMKASLRVLLEAGAQIDIETIEIGEQVYLRGVASGIEKSSWESLRRTKVLYKAPITTPQGGGYKSLNVTIRKTLGLYANVRPTASYYPAIETKHPLMDMVIIRENEEDTYAGIEHRQTREVYQTLKLISQPGTEKIIRYAFEFARRNNRKKVSALTKDNIMKLTDGIFHKVFDEIGKEYPDIEQEHMIIDIGTARLADTPERFNVVVVPNLYGDILSDVASQLTGSVGLGVSSNIGDTHAMFEAVHGSAPDIAGRGIANPSGLLLAAVPMLVHIGQPDVAEKIHNAWKRTIEDGIHTGDIYRPERSQKRVSTDEFADAVIERLGQQPEILRPVSYAGLTITKPHNVTTDLSHIEKDLVGVDVFLDWDEADRDPNVIGKALSEAADNEELALVMITNRGQKVYPDGMPETFCTDHWRCRFQHPDNKPVTHQQIVSLLQRVHEGGFDFIKTENLYTFDGERGFSLGQGQ
jgi:isocitrate dehydrogenase